MTPVGPGLDAVQASLVARVPGQCRSDRDSTASRGWSAGSVRRPPVLPTCRLPASLTGGTLGQFVTQLLGAGARDLIAGDLAHQPEGCRRRRSGLVELGRHPAQPARGTLRGGARSRSGSTTRWRIWLAGDRVRCRSRSRRARPAGCSALARGHATVLGRPRRPRRTGELRGRRHAGPAPLGGCQARLQQPSLPLPAGAPGARPHARPVPGPGAQPAHRGGGGRCTGQLSAASPGLPTGWLSRVLRRPGMLPGPRPRSCRGAAVIRALRRPRPYRQAIGTGCVDAFDLLERAWRADRDAAEILDGIDELTPAAAFEAGRAFERDRETGRTVRSEFVRRWAKIRRKLG